MMVVLFLATFFLRNMPYCSLSFISIVSIIVLSVAVGSRSLLFCLRFSLPVICPGNVFFID